VRAILGVEHGDVGAARAGEADIERLGFGARRRGGDDDDFDVRRTGDGERGCDGDGIIALNEEFYIELVGWIIRTYASKWCRK